MSSHAGTKLRITPEFYGAVFRVRAEKGNDVSEWQYSNPVKCVNGKDCFMWLCVPSILNVCLSPLISLTQTSMFFVFHSYVLSSYDESDCNT